MGLGGGNLPLHLGNTAITSMMLSDSCCGLLRSSCSLPPVPCSHPESLPLRTNGHWEHEASSQPRVYSSICSAYCIIGRLRDGIPPHGNSRSTVTETISPSIPRTPHMMPGSPIPSAAGPLLARFGAEPQGGTLRGKLLEYERHRHELCEGSHEASLHQYENASSDSGCASEPSPSLQCTGGHW